MIDFFVGFMVMVGIYAVFTLGLNVHWGHTGLFNIGIAGFFALGAYTAALLTIRPPLTSQVEDYLFAGDLANRFESIPLIGALDLWFFVALLAAAVVEVSSRSSWGRSRYASATTISRSRRSASPRACG